MKGVERIKISKLKILSTNLGEIQYATKQDLIFKIKDLIKDKWRFLTFDDTDEIFYYKDGIYHPNAEALIKTKTQNNIGLLANTRLVTEVINHIKRETYINRAQFNNCPNIFCVQNGILDVLNGELKPHTPEEIFFSKIPVEYNPEADCPKIKKFFSEILHKEDILIMEEFIGYCLYKDYIIHKAFILIGDGENGKTTFLNLLTAFLGKENIAEIALQDFSHRFKIVVLQNKLANIFDDLTDKSVKETGMFKMLTGKSGISAEIKYKQKHIPFTNYAKMIFACNKPPTIESDDSHAFWRRWTLINFPNTFIGDNKDPFILEIITSTEELSGLLNIAMKGLNRLLLNKEFSYSISTEQTKEDYIRKSDPFGAFVMDFLEIGGNENLPKKGLYKDYVEFCNDNKLPKVTYPTFCSKITTRFGNNVSEAHPRIDGKQVAVWINLNCKFKTKKTDSKESKKDEQQKLGKN